MDTYKFNDCLGDFSLGFDEYTGRCGYFIDGSFIPFSGFEENEKAHSTLDTLYELACWTETHSNINKSTNCPNCGAPITSSKCDYCGTNFEASAMWGMRI